MGIDNGLIRNLILGKQWRQHRLLFQFQYVLAARVCLYLEAMLDRRSLAVLVDVSGAVFQGVWQLRSEPYGCCCGLRWIDSHGNVRMFIRKSD